MQITLAFAALAAVAYAAPQGVTATLAPSSPAPSGFSTSYPGKFQITAVNITVASAKRDISKRAACPTATGTLLLTLDDGILKDELNRTGYIASNYQLQFDGPENGPVQDGAIYDAGFSVGSNDSLALGSSAVFYQCLSGSFYNLYSQSTGAQCNPVLINILPCGATSSGAITQSSDGQVEGTAVATAVSQLTDGQPQAQSAVPVTVSQISDGQIQAPTGVPVSQISDGQIQAPTSTAAPVSQISDGQIQAPTGVAISQISDGQIQAPTSTAAPITQISDGQIQAPTATPVSQISDGQIQAPVASTGVVPSSNGTTVASATLTQVTGSANSLTVGTGVFAAVFGVVAALL